MGKTLTEKTTTEKLVTKRCSYCNTELRVDKELSRKVAEARKDSRLGKVLNREYESCYVSPIGSFYCDPHCFVMFTED